MIPPFAVVARQSDLPLSITFASQTKLACATQLRVLPPITYHQRLLKRFKKTIGEEGVLTSISTRNTTAGSTRGTGASILLETSLCYAAGTARDGTACVLTDSKDGCECGGAESEEEGREWEMQFEAVLGGEVLCD